MELIFRNLYKKYNSSEKGFILNIPILTLTPNEFTTVMGRNGSGKSVLLKILSKNIKNENSLDFGKIEYNSVLVRQNSADDLALELTVLENLILHYQSNGFLNYMFPKSRLKKEMKKYLIGHSSLGNKLDDQTLDLSGGQKQALAFLCKIMNTPDLLCLDEFLSSLDLDTKGVLINMLNKLKSDTILIAASHDVELTLKISDRIIFIENGKIIDDFLRSSSNWNKSYLYSKFRNG